MNVDETPDSTQKTIHQPEQPESIRSEKQKESESDASTSLDRLIASIPAQIKNNWFWILAYSFNFIYFAVALIRANLGDASLTIPILPGMIFTCIIFVQIYSDQIESPAMEGLNQEQKKELEEKRSRQRDKWMIFAYSFMLLSLLMTFYPFITSFDKPNAAETFRDRPISIFVGCSLDSKSNNLSCFKSNSKSVDNQESTKHSAATDPDEQLNNQAVKDAPTTYPQSAGAWVINIGGHVNKCSSNNPDSYGKAITCEVSGGLLVPLYFIILALMGGSISLTRRLPELQKQAGAEHIATEKQPKLTQYEFREYLIFQMVQFISAPFLAILAYYLIEPSNTTNAVALAFTAGFASETILLMVRSIANKISPNNHSGPQYGAVAGVVTLNNKDKNFEKPAQKAEVSLSESPQIHSITDEKGFYILGNVPVGEHSINIKYMTQVNNKSEERIKKDMVKIERAQAIVKKNVTLTAEDSTQQ
ncbi:MAG: hypothetical protein K2Q13_13275 [Nitrosomonas sp.]|uniref:hypothetical protein n=1 Tax=Nitrosomonas sp. TaxID=42353 RepID=UPI0025E12B9F|nr:hypothetical protein [Nitrosomonas sp.]MBY0476002.1 hypothetical protein [Nitrosomonas sp.]